MRNISVTIVVVGGVSIVAKRHEFNCSHDILEKCHGKGEKAEKNRLEKSHRFGFLLIHTGDLCV